MQSDIDTCAKWLARDSRISDYHLWRTLKNVNYDLHRIKASNEPIPFELIRYRAVLTKVSEARRLP